MTDDKQRSNEQNRYLWGVAYEVLIEAMRKYHPGKHWLQIKDDWHELFCEGFFGTVDVGFPGSRKTRPKRTTTRNEEGKRDIISTTEFQDFVRHIQETCAEHHIDIPDVNEVPMLTDIPESYRD